MPHYATLIDDGQAVASDARTTYVDMNAAVSAVLCSAAQIAEDAVAARGCPVVVECEVMECATRRRKAYRLVFDLTGRRTTEPGPNPVDRAP